MNSDSSSNLKGTPLYARHLELGARMVPFAGYNMPVQYSGVLDETKATRSHAGLFDVSHMGQFSITGPGHLEAVAALVTNQPHKIALGQAQYNMLCNEAGGVIDDLVIYRRSEKETFICVNASNRQADFEWMTSRLPASVTLEDQSESTALIALQGPNAEAILKKGATDTVVTGLDYYWATDTTVFGSACYLSRTGYTGEDGFELYLPADKASHVWNQLLEVGRPLGLVPVGLGARDTLRLEMGYPLHGHELSTEINPLEANLNWTVKLDRTEPFVGQKALQKIKADGVKRKLVAMVLNDRRLARAGYRIGDCEHHATGTVTSGSMSPHREAPIAMGFVDTTVMANLDHWIEVRETWIAAKAVALPFVPSHTKKKAKT